MKEIIMFMNALHTCTNEKLVGYIEKLENDEYELENNYTVYELLIEERKVRGI